MKILLKEDVETLGAVGDIVTVADGYARNYLIPQGLAVKATPGQVKQVDVIRQQALQRREQLAAKIAALTEKINGIQLAFEAKASERGRLYGSVTKESIVEALEAELGEPVDRRKVETDPLRQVGLHAIPVRLSAEMIPEVTVIVHREGEDPAIYLPVAEEETEVESVADGQAGVETVEDQADAQVESQEAPVEPEIEAEEPSTEA
jgi:large subunit ribosomal protein L9